MSQSVGSRNEDDGRIGISVRGQDEHEVFFKIRPFVNLSKLMGAYCVKRKLDCTTVQFLYNGKRITKKHTPAKLEMENGDKIDAMLHVSGGGCKGF